jgi:hypothetical protein
MPPEYLQLVSKPKNVTVEIKNDGTDQECDTVPFIIKKVLRTVYQVEQLARKLTGPSTFKTLENDWNFVFTHIRYVKDPDNIEAVRDPSRTIWEAKGDCDCFTVLLGALLLAQQIPFRIRVAAYDSPGEWSHVYIIVPITRESLNERDHYIVVDPVLDSFNDEAPFLNKKDFEIDSMAMPENTIDKSKNNLLWLCLAFAGFLILATSGENENPGN